jgi:mono/diheme cytochrome c family protein
MSQNDKPISATLDTAEPTVGPAEVPIWLLVFLGCLFYWGINFLDGHAGGFNNQVFEPFDSVTEVASLQPYDPVRQQLAMGKDVFDKTCATCHQPNGMGKAGQFPPLAGSDWINAPMPTRIGRIVLNGLSGSVTVKLESGGPPVSLNAAMAPLGDNYDDEHLAAALTYVRQQWGNHGSPVTAEQMKAIRAASAGKHGSWNPDDLMKMPLTDPLAK